MKIFAFPRIVGFRDVPQLSTPGIWSPLFLIIIHRKIIENVSYVKILLMGVHYIKICFSSFRKLESKKPFLVKIYNLLYEVEVGLHSETGRMSGLLSVWTDAFFQWVHSAYCVKHLSKYTNSVILVLPFIGP